MDIQVSLVRLLSGDNDRTAPTYSDAELRTAVTLRTRAALPIGVRLAGLAAVHRYPSDDSGGPFTGPF